VSTILWRLERSRFVGDGRRENGCQLEFIAFIGRERFSGWQGRAKGFLELFQGDRPAINLEQDRRKIGSFIPAPGQAQQHQGPRQYS
jgi:hypothetical protein